MQSADLRIKRAQADINEALGVKPQPPAQNPDIGYGRREDGSNKGRGFYGMLPRTDGPDQSSELSIGVEMDGKQRTIPSMVPGLNAEQLRYLLSVQKPMRPDITQKAVDFAVQRQQQGKGPFAEPNEEGAYRVPRYAQGGSVKAQRFATGGGAWTRKEGKNPEGGLNAKGRASLKAQGHDIKPPVSAKLAAKSPKAAARRKSFCARMTGMPGPMKDEKGRPTRKALSLRKWDC